MGDSSHLKALTASKDKSPVCNSIYYSLHFHYNKLIAIYALNFCVFLNDSETGILIPVQRAHLVHSSVERKEQNSTERHQ